MTTTAAVRQLAARIAAAQAAPAQRSEQLAHSALEDGAIREFSLEGAQVAQYGQQFDGTSMAATLISPPPPAPSTPVAVGVPGGIKVFWNGTFENDITVVAPMDWRQVDVVAGPVGMDPIATPPSVAITSPRGGEVFIPAVPGNYEIALVSRTLAGRPSEASVSVAATALALVDDAQFQQALTDLTAAEGRLDIAEGDIDDNLTEIEAAKVRITATEANANNALAGLLKKNSVFVQASAPTSTGRIEGDIWIDFDDNEKVYRWSTVLGWVLTDIASVGYIASRATDLVTNGTGLLKNNRNFAAFDFDPLDAPTGSAGAFVAKGTAPASYATDEVIPFDPAKQYRLSFQIKQKVAGATNRAYGFLQPCDIDALAIDPGHYMFITGTKTTLAAQLNPGDTTITLASAANWYGTAAKPAGAASYFRSIQFWNHVDGAGKAWAPYTYTRNKMALDVYADGSVNAATGVITLRAPYAGPVVPSGTPVSQPSAGGSYLYMPTLTNGVIAEAWTAYADTFSAGVLPPASQEVPSTGAALWSTGMPPGTAQLRVGWLLNYAPSPANPTVGRMAVASVSLSDASAAQKKATDALALAAAKATVFRQSSAPASGMVANDLWFDIDDGRVYVFTTVWSLSDDPRISDALTNAAIAQQAAEKNDAVNANPSFSGWSGALPDAWAAYGTGPTKETAAAYVRTPPNAARFNCTDTTTERGMYHALSDLPVGTEYVTVSVDIRAASGDFGGTGILLDWSGMGGTNRVSWAFKTDVPTPVVGKWYRLTKVLRRPTGATGTQTSWITYFMASYVGSPLAPKTVKDISVDRVAYRASTTEEIAAYNAASAATVSTLTTTVNTKTTVFVQTSQPSTTGRTIGDLWLDSDDGNKPYDWTGTWTARQFGDSALASLDLNKLVVVGTANLNVAVANEIAAKTAAFQTADIGNLFVTGTSTLDDVVAQQIAADTGEFLTIKANNLESVMALVTKLTSGGTGRRWEADADGIRVFESDGSILINFPTDPNTPASFYGDLFATSLTVSDQLAIRGLVNEISKGAQVVLAGGTTAPTSPPTVTIDWEALDASYNPTPSSTWDPYRSGWSFYNNNYYTTQSVYAVGTQISKHGLNGVRDWAYSFTLDTVIWKEISSTMIGNVIYVLGQNDAGTAWRVQGWNVDTQARVQDWAFVPGAGTNPAKIGNDGTNLILAWNNVSNGRVYWQKYTPAGALSGALVDTGASSSLKISAVTGGTHDVGSQRVYIMYAGSNIAWAFTAAGARSQPDDFYVPTSNIVGLAWDGARFVSFDAAGAKMYHHTSTRWTGAESTLWHASNTWYDGDATGGTHETAQGPRKSFTMKKRARLLLTTGVIPVRPIPNTTDDAKAARIYIGRGAADPGRTYMERIATLADNERNYVGTAITLPAGLATSPPPAASDFPASSPGRIISADGTTLVLNGDGSGNWGSSPNAPVVSPTGVVTGIPRMAEGSGTVPIVAAGAASANIVLTFPANRFTSPPKVFVSSASGRLTPFIGTVTTTQGNIAFNNWSPAASAAAAYSWVAIQTT